MYSLAINNEYNSTEIKFDEKPSYQIRTALVGLGFRWHKVKGVWFGRKTPEEVEKAIQGAKSGQESEESSTVDNSTKDEKNAREARKKEYIDIIMKDLWERHPSMRKHYEKKLFDVCILSDGSMLEIDKSDIETRFCFGYGQNGYSTAEDRREANRMEEYAMTNQDYFINENLKGIDKQIKHFEEEHDFRIVPHYYKQRDNRLKEIVTYKPFGFGAEYADAPKVSKEDITLYVQALKAERENFVKRLNAYLKRYGLSKLHTWTYLSD